MLTLDKGVDLIWSGLLASCATTAFFLDGVAICVEGLIARPGYILVDDPCAVATLLTGLVIKELRSLERPPLM